MNSALTTKMKTILQILLTSLWLISIAVSVSAQTDKTIDELTAKIDKEVADIDALWRKNKDAQKEFVVIEQKDVLTLGQTPANFDYKDTEASYILLYDSNGRLLSHAEMPTSVSGDWGRELIHYFDSNGKTIMFKDHSFHYNSGCTYLLHVTKRYYLDTQFRVIKESTAYTDKDKKPPTKCEQYGADETDEHVMQPDYVAIQKRIERNLIKYKKQRIKEDQIQREWNDRMARQRLQWAKDDEEYDRQVEREHIKDIIRTTLYTISALSILAAIILLIRNKIIKKKAENS